MVFVRLRALRRHVYARVPLWMRKNDFQLFTAVLCFSAGVPLLLTHKVDAASIEASLPLPLVKVWALMLAVAPICIGFGLGMAGTKPIALVTFWLRLEAYGLRTLAYAAYVYVICILAADGLKVLPAIAIILIFGLTCHSRATDVTIKVEDFLSAIGARRVE